MYNTQSQIADDFNQPQQVWGNTPKPKEISLIEPIRPNYSPKIEPIDDQSWKLKALMKKMSDYVKKTNHEQRKKQNEIDDLRLENARLRSQNDRLLNEVDRMK